MPETGTTTTTQSGGIQQLIEQMFPGLVAQIQGMIGGGGADTSSMHGVGDEFMNLVQQLYGGPNATQQGGLDTLRDAQDMSKIQGAYKNYYGSIAAPTILNDAISGGLGQGAATEAQGLAGAQAGVGLSQLQNAAQGRYGQAQVDVGGGLTKDILSALGGAGTVYGNEADIQQRGHGQDLGALGGMLNSILGYRPPTTTAVNTGPFWPTNLQNVLAAIQTGSGLYQGGTDAIKKLYDAWASSQAGGAPNPSMAPSGGTWPSFMGTPNAGAPMIDLSSGGGAGSGVVNPIDYTTPAF